jgi:hypothetical protein
MVQGRALLSTCSVLILFGFASGVCWGQSKCCPKPKGGSGKATLESTMELSSSQAVRKSSASEYERAVTANAAAVQIAPQDMPKSLAQPSSGTRAAAVTGEGLHDAKAASIPKATKITAEAERPQQ